MKLTITPSEWHIIEHRLSLNDCISEVLESTYDWPLAEIDAKTCALYDAMTAQMKAKGRIELDLATLDAHTKEILRESLEGSTYFCSIEDAVATGELSRGRALSMEKAAQSLERKFTEADERLTIPRA